MFLRWYDPGMLLIEENKLKLINHVHLINISTLPSLQHLNSRQSGNPCKRIYGHEDLKKCCWPWQCGSMNLGGGASERVLREGCTCFEFKYLQAISWITNCTFVSSPAFDWYWLLAPNTLTGPSLVSALLYMSQLLFYLFFKFMNYKVTVH